MKSIFFWLFYLLLIISCNIVWAKTGYSVPHANLGACDKLEPVLQPWIDKGVFQGNLLLTQKDKVICSISVGYADAKQQRKMLTDSRFAIASLSKPIVASLFLKLQEKGVLDLQSTVADYLPEFPATWSTRVTLHHLLANRSGLPGHYRLPGWQSVKHQNVSSKTELLSEIAGMTLAFPPGSDYLYTNLGWTLLVEIVEHVTGKSLAENLQQHIFTPLALPNMGVLLQSTAQLVDPLTWGRQGGWDTSEVLNRQIFHGGAGIYSTVHDLAQYLNTVHQTDWLSATSKSRLLSTDAPYGWRNETLRLSVDFEKRVFSYDGQLQGFSSFVYHQPDEAISVVILSNTSMGFAHKKALADDTLRAFYDIPLSSSSSSPSLVLNRSLLADGFLENQWQSTLKALPAHAIDDPLHASLLYDLAQQLDWSGNTKKAIALYAGLARSFPDNQGLKKVLERLCANHAAYYVCQETAENSTPDTINIGMTILPLHDPARKAWRSHSPRPVTTHVFYQTQDKQPKPLMLGPAKSPLFVAGNVVQNAEPLAGKRPLVMMSHGTGGSAPQMLWLAQALVKGGYVVAAVNHHGNTAFEDEKLPEGFLLWWERAQDLQVVRRQLLQDKLWRNHLDENKTAVVGFSLGGYTALSTLGGITDKALFYAYCQSAEDDFSCQPQPEFTSVLEALEQVKDSTQVLASLARQHNNYQIPNLKAAVAIAPAVVHAFRPESLKQIATPTLFVVGNKDKIAPAKSNSEYAHTLLPNSQFLSVENAHHYSFLSSCTEHGKHILPELCNDPYGVSRAEVRQQTIKAVQGFLKDNIE